MAIGDEIRINSLAICVELRSRELLLRSLMMMI